MAYDRRVMIDDFGVFKTVSATANGVISGGAFATAQSGTNSLSSGAASYGGPTDILVDSTSTSGNVAPPIGMAVDTTASGSTITILRECLGIVEASAAISAGDKLRSTQSGTNLGQVAPVVRDSSGATIIGQALTQGADGEFILAHLRF